jgi:hypothetical protein
MTEKKIGEDRQKLLHELGMYLSSPTGTKLLTELATDFDPDDISGPSVESTYFNLGARHVYRVLKTLRDKAQKEP